VDESVILFNITDYYGKKSAVMETGYTTLYWHPIDFPHNETKQQQFINTALPVIRDEIQTTEKTSFL